MKAMRTQQAETRDSGTRTAHPLFPVDQAFLWLPGFTGEHEHPYCTMQNESVEDADPGDIHPSPSLFLFPFSSSLLSSSPASMTSSIRFHRSR